MKCLFAGYQTDCMQRCFKNVRFGRYIIYSKEIPERRRKLGGEIVQIQKSLSIETVGSMAVQNMEITYNRNLIFEIHIYLNTPNYSRIYPQ